MSRSEPEDMRKESWTMGILGSDPMESAFVRRAALWGEWWMEQKKSKCLVSIYSCCCSAIFGGKKGIFNEICIVK